MTSCGRIAPCASCGDGLSSGMQSMDSPSLSPSQFFMLTRPVRHGEDNAPTKPLTPSPLSLRLVRHFLYETQINRQNHEPQTRAAYRVRSQSLRTRLDLHALRRPNADRSRRKIKTREPQGVGACVCLTSRVRHGLSEAKDVVCNRWLGVRTLNSRT